MWGRLSRGLLGPVFSGRPASFLGTCPGMLVTPLRWAQKAPPPDSTSVTWSFLAMATTSWSGGLYL